MDPRPRLLLFTALLSLSGCKSLDFVDLPEAKDWNLTQLHDLNQV